ncbi:ATP-binding cassette domain-containing protein [Gluconacetobacter azotocaptans]|uniref:ATP-binding cassette domain-containing protein n=2 Tax=Gluconacetobacter azotocaptans TaxID=142834 RepID=A0A7W4PDS7_9PROT|nr:ATP-binding cassette domain-containing protein [Gluconacetobacter azotocaptans]MBB2188669.1 ATP-binding cassette domain-containing protein [Gluconacetobacter azotocaptans]GBQ35157.1 spermidine/putrescine ABC transporter ATP-binding protein [Gluconacetobacter azotocaptans DSM 13594]
MRRTPGTIRILGGILTLYLLAPFAAGLSRMGDADWRGVDRAALLHAAGVSVASATAATALVAVAGIPLGYVLAHGRGWRMAVLGGVVQLPLALPPLASGILLLFLLGYGGLLGGLMHGALTESFAGIVLAEAFVAAPFLIVAARSAFAAIDPALEDVAATLGHGPGAVFRRIGLPLARRAILAGLLLAWLRAFGEFGATMMVAYHPYSLPVFTYVAFGGAGLPAMLPVLAPTLAVAALVLVLGQVVAAPRRGGGAVSSDVLPPVAAGPAAMGPGQALVLDLRQCLEGFALRVEYRTRARRLAILGASGSGKSMSLRTIAGLERGAGSVVRCDGRDLAALPPEARGIAYVPQGYALPPHLTVAQQVGFAVDSDPALVAHWMAAFGLAELSRRYPHELSPGQRQRVALARALSRPSAGLVLLDEPFSALDAPLRARLRQDVLAVQGGVRATTILVTHDPAEAMLLADELLVLEGGRVIRAGPVDEVFSRPGGEVAARLLGARTIGTGDVLSPTRIDIGGGVALGVAGAPLTPGARVRWAVRPHQVRLDQRGEYPATILHRGAVRDGQRSVRLRLGEAVLDIVADPSCPDIGPCGVTIDPLALQVWPQDG